ncbi:DNA helicase [Tanacetum coccineum]
MLLVFAIKYISKDTERIFARVSKPVGTSSTEAGPSRQMVDEIENYVEGLFVCAHEAYWRILKFDIHRREPDVQVLSVHLQDMQRVTFRDRDRLESVVNLPGKKDTTLTEWFSYNTANEDGDDRQWEIAIEEACGSATPEQLRYVFAHILLHCKVTNPSRLWVKYWKEMSHDMAKRVSQTVQIPNYHLNDDSLQGYTLYELEVILNNCGKSLQDFGLRQPLEDLLTQLSNRLLMGERNYNVDALKNEKNDLVPKLNVLQTVIYDLIINANSNNRQELIFVYGHGGTGKTFLWKAIISSLRSEEKIVLAVASSGIASLLLPSGRTAHSRFKLPLELTEESLCRITKNSHLGKLLADTDLIIWDEAPMNDRRCFEALDRTLRDILCQPASFFGGKSILLGGDFRQTLPVKKGASKMEIIASCISESQLWSSFKIFILKENMRLARSDISLEERSMINSFASWLLDIGDGNIGQADEEEPENASWVDVPPSYCVPPDDQGLAAEMELSTIAELTPNSTNKTLEAKVYRKWIAKSPPEMTPYAFCCLLLDQEGSTIQATMDLSDVDYFNAKLEMGMAYRISNFNCQVTSRYQQTLENGTSLRFGRYTSFDKIPATTFPHHFLQFTSHNQLESKLPKLDNNNKM